MFRRFVKSFRYLLNPRPPPRSPAETSSSSPTLEPLQPSQETDVPVCESFASLAVLTLPSPEARAVYILAQAMSRPLFLLDDTPGVLKTKHARAQDVAPRSDKAHYASSWFRLTRQITQVTYGGTYNQLRHCWKEAKHRPANSGTSAAGLPFASMLQVSGVARVWQACCTVWQACCKVLQACRAVLQG